MSNDERECLELLQDPEGTNLFREYLKSAYAAEVLNLWVEIQLYKSLEEPKQMQEKGQEIYDKYCTEGEASEVNLDEHLRLCLKQSLDDNNMECTTFDIIHTHVFDLLVTDCFMGFRRTDSYLKYKTQRNAKGEGNNAYFIFYSRIRRYYDKKKSEFTDNTFLVLILLTNTTQISIAFHFSYSSCIQVTEGPSLLELWII